MFSGGCMKRYWVSWYDIPKNPEQTMLDLAVKAVKQIDESLSDAKCRAIARVIFGELRAANFSVGVPAGYEFRNNASLNTHPEILEIQRWAGERPRKKDGAAVISAVIEAPDSEVIIQAIEGRAGELRFITQKDDGWMPNTEIFNDQFAVAPVVNGAAAEQ